MYVFRHNEICQKISSGVIFAHQKCHLDEEVLQVASSHFRKKEEVYWKRIEKYCNNYFKKKNKYTKALDELKENNTKDNLPIKIVKPLCIWKKRRSDKKMPSKQDKLMHRWNETKDRKDLSLEEYLKATTVYEIYERDHKGQKLTMDLINQMIVSNTTL